METIVPCVEYVESHLNQLSSDSLSESDLLGMLSGAGGFQVDVVLYLIAQSKSTTSARVLRSEWDREKGECKSNRGFRIKTCGY